MRPLYGNGSAWTSYVDSVLGSSQSEQGVTTQSHAAGGGGGGIYDRSRNELTLPRIFGASEQKAKEVGSRGK